MAYLTPHYVRSIRFYALNYNYIKMLRNLKGLSGLTIFKVKYMTDNLPCGAQIIFQIIDIP